LSLRFFRVSHGSNPGKTTELTNRETSSQMRHDFRLYYSQNSLVKSRMTDLQARSGQIKELIQWRFQCHGGVIAAAFRELGLTLPADRLI